MHHSPSWGATAYACTHSPVTFPTFGYRPAGFTFQYKAPLSWDVGGKYVFFLFIEGFVYFGLLLLIEKRFFIKLRRAKTGAGDYEPCEDVCIQRGALWRVCANLL